MSKTRGYMCVDIRGAMKNLERSRDPRSYMVDGEGRELSKDEAMTCLTIELAKGREVLPVHPKCGAPCENSPYCGGFKYSGEHHGCPGYPVE